MVNKVFILGGYGDIGQKITNKFIENNYIVKQVGRKDFDLSNKKEIDTFFDNYNEDANILVHCAGTNTPKSFEELSYEEILYSINANVTGFLCVVKKFLNHWIKEKYGKIIVVSSLYGTTSRKKRLPYTLSKHALNGIVKSLAIELGEKGILVNSISPGYISTKLTEKNNSKNTISKIKKSIPLKRLGNGEEIADTVLFLSSYTNSYINGQDLVVDGGFSVGGYYSFLS